MCLAHAGFALALPACSADFGIDVGRNIIHGSDSVESAMREVGAVQFAAAGLRLMLSSWVHGWGATAAIASMLCMVRYPAWPLRSSQIALWFRADELADYTPVATAWIYE